MNMWNRHIHAVTQNVHNVYKTHIDNIGIPKHKKHLWLLSSGMKLYMRFELKGFSTWGRERHNLSMMTFPSPPNHVRHLLSSKSQPSSDGKTQLTDFFQIPKILHAPFRCMKSFPLPSPVFYLRFLLWHLWMTHLLHVRINTCTHVCT